MTDGKKRTFRSKIDYTKKIFACKIYDTENYAQDELDLVFKEVKINSMVRSDYCIRYH